MKRKARGDIETGLIDRQGLVSVIAATAAARSTRSVPLLGKIPEWRFITEKAPGTGLPFDTAAPAAGAIGFPGIIASEKQSRKSVATMITHELNGRHCFSDPPVTDTEGNG